MACTQSESDPAVRRNELHEVEPGGAHTASVEANPVFGASTQGSPMRSAVRDAGMMEGQVHRKTHVYSRAGRSAVSHRFPRSSDPCRDLVTAPLRQVDVVGGDPVASSAMLRHKCSMSAACAACTTVVSRVLHTALYALRVRVAATLQRPVLQHIQILTIAWRQGL